MTSERSSKRVLEPIDRVSEVLFGLIMVLTFTGGLSVAEAGREDVRIMLIGALGCNLAWGVIDGVLYLMASLAERAREASALDAIREAADSERASQLIADALPRGLAAVVGPGELAMIHQRIVALPPTSAPTPRLSPDDWSGALGVFLLVVLSTFPVVIPFLILTDARPAL